VIQALFHRSFRIMFRVPITMPQLGESIAEATIQHLYAQVGDSVQADHEVMEVETQKAVMTVTTPCAGQLSEWTCEIGQSYPVGATLGYLVVSPEDAARAGIKLDSPDAPSASPANNAHTSPEESGGAHYKPEHDREIMERQRVHPTVSGLPVPAGATGAAYISPRMRVRMQELGLNAADLAGLPGSGAGGRVTVEDFESYLRRLEEHKMTPASHMRIAVADSMRRSWTRPLATVGMPVQLDTLLAHRRAQPDPKPGPALYAMRALALALAENTAIAGRLIGEHIVHPKAIDIGFAVEVDDGVLVPIIKDVDQRPLRELVDYYNELVQKARERKLPPEARGLGIATVTNFGTFGIVWATPIPLPEQNLVLGLGAGRKSPVWDESTAAFAPKTEAQLTLSFDHRVLDGGAAGRLLNRVATLMQEPEKL
jgi:pyruvate/2-oxoglutarate dehydrogenase complex dihydrolipoamide acyltransferase (E2) component